MRIRTVKPELFLHEVLFELEAATGLPIRLAYIGIWCACDRNGRFYWRPRTLKACILPHDNVDFSRVLDALLTRGFIRKYSVEGQEYGYVPSWHKHQFVNNKEKGSDIPEPPKMAGCDATATRGERDADAIVTDGVKEGKGKERKGKENTQPRVREEILPADGEAFETPITPITPITPSGNTASYALGRDRLSRLIACMKRVSPDRDIAELGVTVDVHADKLARREKWFDDHEIEAILKWCKTDEFEGWRSAALDPAMFVAKFDKFYTKYQVQNPNKRSRQDNTPQKPRINSSELERQWAREIMSGERTWSEIVKLYGEAATREVCERTGFDPLSIKRVSVSDKQGSVHKVTADLLAMAGIKRREAT